MIQGKSTTSCDFGGTDSFDKGVLYEIHIEAILGIFYNMDTKYIQVMIMTKWFKMKTLFLCGVLMLCLCTSGFAAVSRDEGETDIAEGRQPVYVDGVLEYTAYSIDGTVYVPLRSFFTPLKMGAVVSGGGETMVVRFTAPDGRSCRLQAEAGDFYLKLNDRAVYLGSEMRCVDGNLLVPMKGLCDGFGMEMQQLGDGWNLDTAKLRVCADGASVYNQNDLRWLSHIINAEAGNQTMEGQICVGNVVLNRVKDSRFPDTVEAVVFAPNQFCPVKSGTIWCTPDEDAVIAAKLCLEGVSLAGESIYFVNPVTGSTRWFRENLTYAMSVGERDFYY